LKTSLKPCRNFPPRSIKQTEPLAGVALEIFLPKVTLNSRAAPHFFNGGVLWD